MDTDQVRSKRNRVSDGADRVPGVSILAVVAVIAATTLALLGSMLGLETAHAQAPVASPIAQGGAPGAPATVFYPALAGIPPQPNELRGVSRVVYSPDGTTLTVGNPNGIYLYAAQSLQGLAYIYTGMAVTALAYSPDSSLIASGSFTNTIQVWDVRSAGLVREMSAAMGAVTGVAFSPDGQTIASVSNDGHVRLWNAADGVLLRDLLGHNGAAWAVTFSPDGSLVASGGVDGSVRLWQVATGASVTTLVGSIGGVTSIAFAPDGNSMAFGSGDGLVRVWDIRNGTIVRTMSGHQGSVTDVVYSPDGRAIGSISYDGTGILWSTTDGTQIRTLTSTTGALSSESIDPTGLSLAVGAVDGAVEIWPLADILTIQIPSYAAVCRDDLAFVADVTIPDGSILLPGTLFYKAWRVQNTGTCAWGPGYRLAFVSGSQLGAVNTVAIPPVQPNGLFDIAAPMFAPPQPGAYRGLWQMINPAGQRFGPQFFVSIVVPAPVAVAPPPLVDITASATNVNAGDSVTIRARVENVQAAWLDGDPVVNNARDKTVQLCNDATFTLVAALRTGEQTERSVTVSVNGSCATPKADLTIRDLRADRTNPRTGQTVRFTARIRNQGDSDANNFDFVWQPSGSSRFIQIAGALSLAAGQETNVAWDFTFNAPGTFSTRAVVDSNNAVDESDKDNNRRVLTIFVEAAPVPTPIPLANTPVPTPIPLMSTPVPAPVPGLADLLIRDVRADNGNPQVGQVVHFRAIVRNQGDADASNFDFVWRPSGSSPFIQIAAALNLPARQETTVTWDYTFNAPGGVSTEAVVDSNNAVPESNKENNRRVLTINVKPAPEQASPTPVPPTSTPVPANTPVPGKADLLIRDVQADNGNPQVGQVVHLRAIIRNQGNADASNFDFVWRPSGSSPFIQIAAALNLPARQETTVTWDYTFNAPGGVNTEAVVDSNNAVPESSKDNNRRVLAINVKPAPAPVAPTASATPVPPVPANTAAPAPAAPAIRVDPGEATVGDTIRVTGENWPANADLKVMLAVRQPLGRLGVDPGEAIMKSRSDQTGRFDVQFAVPESWPPAANTVLVAATLDNRLVASAPFLVVAGPPPAAAPVPPTAAPVPVAASPVPPTAAPVPVAASPVPPTAAPVPVAASPVPPTAAPVPVAASPVPPALPFPASPAQPGQVQLTLKFDVPNAKAPDQVKFTLNIGNVGSTDLSNLGVWFQPFAGGSWANIATGVTLRSKEQANVSFDYAFAQPGTYAPLVVIQGVEGTPTATIQIAVPGAPQSSVPPGNSGGKGKGKGK